MTELAGIDFDPHEDGCLVKVHTAVSSQATHQPKTSHQRVVACALHYLLEAERVASK